MPILTIYTGTWHRERLLPRLYASLKRQTCKDFLWLVIDDDSTDNTEKLVREWVENEDSFEIRYYKKPNGGIHTVTNMAYRICDTELIMDVDSDDWLHDDSVEMIREKWIENLTDKLLAGIFAKKCFDNGDDITVNFPVGIYYAAFQDFRFKYNCIGDLSYVLNKKILDGVPSRI